MQHPVLGSPPAAGLGPQALGERGGARPQAALQRRRVRLLRPQRRLATCGHGARLYGARNVHGIVILDIELNI